VPSILLPRSANNAITNVKGVVPLTRACVARWQELPRTRAETIHTHVTSYPPSKQNIPFSPPRFPPLYNFHLHSSSFISLLHPNYPHWDPRVTPYSLSLFFLSPALSLPRAPPILPFLPLSPCASASRHSSVAGAAAGGAWARHPSSLPPLSTSLPPPHRRPFFPARPDPASCARPPSELRAGGIPPLLLDLPTGRTGRRGAWRRAGRAGSRALAAVHGVAGSGVLHLDAWMDPCSSSRTPTTDRAQRAEGRGGSRRTTALQLLPRRHPSGATGRAHLGGSASAWISGQRRPRGAWRRRARGGAEDDAPVDLAARAMPAAPRRHFSPAPTLLRLIFSSSPSCCGRGATTTSRGSRSSSFPVSTLLLGIWRRNGGDGIFPSSSRRPLRG
jgi:hypothetical protein